MSLWDDFYYDDGVITVGDVSVDTGLGSDDSGGNAYDPYWLNFDELVTPSRTTPWGEVVDLDDYREDGLPWGWLAAGGVVLVLLYAMRR